MQRLTPLAKSLIGVIGVGALFAAVHTYGPNRSRAEEDGLVIEGAAYWNPLVMYRQLGVEAAPAGTAATAITPSSTAVPT